MLLLRIQTIIMKKGNWIFVFTLIVMASLTRLLPHPPNFTAIGAMALFGGAALSGKVLKTVLPLIALFISDVIINNTLYSSLNEGFTFFYTGAFWTYLSIGLIAISAPYLVKKLSASNVLKGSVLASLLFFIVSNFGVWISGTLYPLNAGGLISTYTAAIPFFANTLISNVLFSALLFGGFYLVDLKFPKLAEIRK